MSAKNLLIIGHVWPEPKSSAAGTRMMQLIDGFQSRNYNIIFASASAKSDRAFDLTSIGIKEVEIELNHKSFDGFVKTLNPEMVIFDRFMTEEQFGWRVAEQSPETLRVLDTEDLHCLRKGRQQAFMDGNPFGNQYLFNDVAKREIASIFRSDLSLIISEVEMDILKKSFKIPADLLLYLPFMLNGISNDHIQALPDFESREHFITIGNFLHEPNYNAVLYLKETLWPMIKKQIPKAEIYIYGSYASQKVNQLNNQQDGFLIKGFAMDVNEVMQSARVCLAPLRFGAGLKGKLVDAMQNGTPCVMTSIAAEGMFDKLPPNGFIEDTKEEFAERAVELFRNETIWKEKQQHGFDAIDTRFNSNSRHEELFSRINYLQENLHHHRYNNFIGQMLSHHSMQSTKFMSKWIEEKNKSVN